jgi:hemolysin activation/secretion protein
VTQAYRQAGYALSFALVPQQKIPDGRFVVRVVEGFVDRVEISGLADGPVKSQMVRIAEHIKTSRPLKSADLERYLLLINDLPGVAMSALISPADVQGGALLTLNASHRRADGAASYLYNYMPLTVAEHLGEFTVRSQSVVTGSDLLSLTFRHSLADAAFGAVSADLSTGIGSDGLRVGLTGYFSNVSPNAPLLRQLEYDGRFVSGRVYAEYAVLRSREQNLRLGAAFGLDDNTSTLLGESLIDDRLREASVWGSYDFTDATGAVTYLKGKFAQGLEILDATGNSRADGNLQYSKFELDARRNQPLLRGAGGLLSLVGALHGQATVSPDGLFSSAECAYGGRAFGRAFDAGVITGAHCLMGSVELHWVKEISFPGFKDPVVFDVYPFVDGGEVWAKGSLQPGEVMSMTASSFGIDLNIQLMPKLFALFEIARELSLSEGTPDQGVRIVGALTVNF